MDFTQNYLDTCKGQYKKYKLYADKAIAQLPDQQLLFKAPNEVSNSIAITMKHMAGNMLSRWTDFLNADGEKEWRHRDREFMDEFANDPKACLDYWEKGWTCVFEALDTVTTDNFHQKVTIRGEEHTILQAINRQLLHYAYHIGQIVYLCRMWTESEWTSLSIPKGKSEQFNQHMKAKK